jgi:Acetyl-coenzyme A synthetase N-terminus
MSENSEQEVSESQIAVHWREEEYYPPPPAFVQQANANDPAILERFTEDKFPDCFTEYADLLHWDKRWDTVLDTSSAPFWKWFTGGKLNACYNCVDRHAEADPGKTAVIWVPELEEDETIRISYGELLSRVSDPVIRQRIAGSGALGARNISLAAIAPAIQTRRPIVPQSRAARATVKSHLTSTRRPTCRRCWRCDS